MIAALFGVGVLVGGDDDERPSAAAPSFDVERVARGVERVRELRFERIPPVRVVSPAEAREEALALLDAEYPPRRRRTDTRLLELLGLLPPGSDLRELAGTIFGEEIAGYYDPRSDRMTVVEEGLARDEALAELTLAHELTHALEDQRFGLETPESRVDDAATADTALHEGTATIAMFDYAAEHLGEAFPGGREQALQTLGASALLGNEKLPPYLQRSLVFPYVEGARFIDAIGTWAAANRALADRGPDSTEQILHPDKFRRDSPQRVRLERSPGSAWKDAVSGTLGEWDTVELIRTSDSPVRAERAAAGWGGGRYDLWRRGSELALALAWTWDTPRDAAELAAALPRYVERTLGGRPAGPGVWHAPGRGFVAVGAGAVVRLAIAPSRALALRLAR